MTNQLSGQGGPSPREYNKHQRHPARNRHSQQALAFLAMEATRLAGTSAQVEKALEKYGADRVKAATNISQLP